ncbi:MAG: hypothetical protein EA361_00460 [Bacteroidetes bacterium]|nr:MAG: hypothetical protein EA361_00460 [Bacteroidota bacterium]
MNKRKKILKIAAIVVVAGLLIGAGVVYYLFNMPHRDVQASATDYQLSTSQLVNEYIDNREAANKKYLAEDGNSKILEITGTVARISENFNGQKVILLREEQDKAGVSFTFSPQTNANAAGLQAGQRVTIKGVIRSGVHYDDDLDMYINAVVDHSDVVRADGLKTEL